MINDDDERVKNKDKPKSSQSLLNPFVFVTQVIMVTIFGIIIAVIVEWAGMSLFWRDEAETHALNGFIYSVSWFSTNVDNQYGYMVLEWFNKHINLQSLALALQENDVSNGVVAVINSFGDFIRVYLAAAIFIILTYIVKLSVVILFMPIVVLTTLLVIVDGLVLRDLRKFKAGNDSGRKYRLAKALVWPTFVGTWFIFLILPISLHPAIILIPLTLLYGYMVRTQIFRITKYW